eukprot:603640_1
MDIIYLTDDTTIYTKRLIQKILEGITTLVIAHDDESVSAVDIIPTRFRRVLINKNQRFKPLLPSDAGIMTLNQVKETNILSLFGVVSNPMLILITAQTAQFTTKRIDNIAAISKTYPILSIKHCKDTLLQRIDLIDAIRASLEPLQLAFESLDNKNLRSNLISARQKLNESQCNLESKVLNIITPWQLLYEAKNKASAMTMLRILPCENRVLRLLVFEFCREIPERFSLPITMIINVASQLLRTDFHTNIYLYEYVLDLIEQELTEDMVQEQPALQPSIIELIGTAIMYGDLKLIGTCIVICNKLKVCPTFSPSID